MTRSKKILLGAAIVVFAPLVILILDINRRTEFPGSKSYRKKPLEYRKDTLRDSIKGNSSPNSATHQP